MCSKSKWWLVCGRRSSSDSTYFHSTTAWQECGGAARKRSACFDLPSVPVLLESEKVTVTLVLSAHNFPNTAPLKRPVLISPTRLAEHMWLIEHFQRSPRSPGGTGYTVSVGSGLLVLNQIKRPQMVGGGISKSDVMCIFVHIWIISVISGPVH